MSWSAKILADRRSMERWINGVNWSIIWPGSHIVSGVPAALAMTGEGNVDFYDWYFDWLDRAADPEALAVILKSDAKQQKNQPMSCTKCCAAQIWFLSPLVSVAEPVRVQLQSLLKLQKKWVL